MLKANGKHLLTEVESYISSARAVGKLLPMAKGNILHTWQTDQLLQKIPVNNSFVILR